MHSQHRHLLTKLSSILHYVRHPNQIMILVKMVIAMLVMLVLVVLLLLMITCSVWEIIEKQLL